MVNKEDAVAPVIRQNQSRPFCVALRHEPCGYAEPMIVRIIGFVAGAEDLQGGTDLGAGGRNSGPEGRVRYFTGCLGSPPVARRLAAPDPGTITL
jgi:hypothetical protein